MEKTDYQKIGKTLLEASDGTALIKLEKLGNGKPLKKDPLNLKSQAAVKFLNTHGKHLAQKMRGDQSTEVKKEVKKDDIKTTL